MACRVQRVRRRRVQEVQEVQVVRMVQVVQVVQTVQRGATGAVGAVGAEGAVAAEGADLGLVDQDRDLAVAGRHGLRRVKQHVQQALGDLAEVLVEGLIARQHLRARRVPAEHVVLREGLLVLLEPYAEVLGVGARLAGGIRRHLQLEGVGDLHVPTDLLAEDCAVDPRARPPATLRPRSRKVVGDVDDDERVQRHFDRGGGGIIGPPRLGGGRLRENDAISRVRHGARVRSTIS
eukprot:scaffold7206_cov57-Phaeocystis_antarctica.AAC.1